ncbi:MAG: polysaccharide pyruvyl transferase family protein [Verrucomicrobiales bacterium]|nr:polysaccharide pyruvyl transferase family protein [Verrucomicrobiales bacterium]
MTEADVVADIRGGDSFSDIYGVKRFVMGSLPTLSVILLRGSVDFLPQTYGPFAHRSSRMLARYMLRRTRRVVARDSEGPSAVRELVGDRPAVVVSPDVAFCLEPLPPQRPEIEPPLPASPPALLVGINVNGLMFNGGYTRSNMFGLKLDYPDFLHRLATRLLENPSIHLLFVPHTFAPPHSVESDPEASRIVVKGLPEAVRSRVHLVTKDYDQHEIKGVIGRCDFFVGSRMHACIAALSQGIPCVGVAYSKKFKGVFESVGMRDWILDGRDVDSGAAVEGVLEKLAIRTSACDVLRSRVRDAQQELRTLFRDMLTPKSAASDRR